MYYNVLVIIKTEGFFIKASDRIQNR